MPLSVTRIIKVCCSGCTIQVRVTSSFVYLLALVNRLLTSLVTASLSTIAVKSASGYSTVSRAPCWAMKGSKRSQTALSSWWIFWEANFIFIPFCSTFRKSSNWFTRNSRRWLLRSIIFRSSRTVDGRDTGDFIIFSKGPMIRDTGVRISWAIMVKNLILASCTSFSLLAFSLFISAVCFFSVRLMMKRMTNPKAMQTNIK